MSASSSSTPSSSSAASATSASTAVSSRPTTAVVEVSALVVGRSGGSSSCSLRSRRAIASSISSTRASQCCRSAFGAGDTRCSVYMSTERTCARSKMGPRHRQPSRFAFARRMGSRSLGSAPSARSARSLRHSTAAKANCSARETCLFDGCLLGYSARGREHCEALAFRPWMMKGFGTARHSSSLGLVPSLYT